MGVSILRSTGYAWDLRRDMPYLAYDQVDFDVVVGSYGDCFDRYAIRLQEIRESIRIVHQILDKMPKGDYRIQDKKVTPPPRARIDESMEALIHHFKIFTEGFKVPEGEAYCAVESPRGELGVYIVADGSSHPYRMHVRAPSFYTFAANDEVIRGHSALGCGGVRSPRVAHCGVFAAGSGGPGIGRLPLPADEKSRTGRRAGGLADPPRSEGGDIGSRPSEDGRSPRG